MTRLGSKAATVVQGQFPMDGRGVVSTSGARYILGSFGSMILRWFSAGTEGWHLGSKTKLASLLGASNDDFTSMNSAIPG
jgi:hypothetical protein